MRNGTLLLIKYGELVMVNSGDESWRHLSKWSKLVMEGLGYGSPWLRSLKEQGEA